MPVEMLTYAELGERLKISPEAARALVKRHRLPRSRSNDGKTLVHVDLAEINHSPAPRGPQPPAGHQVVTALKQTIETLQAELMEMEVIANGHRADFERECERTNKLLAELLKASTESTVARERAALLEGRLSMLTQPWRRRLAEAITLALPQPASNARESVGSPASSASKIGPQRPKSLSNRGPAAALRDDVARRAERWASPALVSLQGSRRTHIG